MTDPFVLSVVALVTLFGVVCFVGWWNCRLVFGDDLTCDNEVTKIVAAPWAFGDDEKYLLPHWRDLDGQIDKLIARTEKANDRLPATAKVQQT